MITVVGSINMDLMVKTAKIPEEGETLLGEEFSTSPGGKGANQAVAAARLGGKVQMIGCVGKDVFGQALTEHLHNENIDVSNISISTDEPTGVANVILSKGDNRIIVIPGANYDLTRAKIDQLIETIKCSDLVIIQLEILPETVRVVVQLCHEFSVPVILNPAPAHDFDMELLSYVDFLTPNETECKQIFKMEMNEALKKYPNKLIVTLGKDGARYFDGNTYIKIPAFMTNAIDTTGAGDTFNGALAYALVQKYTLKDAIAFANAAASFAVEKIGAQSGMPSKEEVDKRLTNIT